MYAPTRGERTASFNQLSQSNRPLAPAMQARSPYGRGRAHNQTRTVARPANVAATRITRQAVKQAPKLPLPYWSIDEGAPAAPTPSAQPPKLFTYVTHSGFGHQLQALLRGLVLSRLTGVPLLVPPMMTHKGNLEINGMKGCAPGGGYGINNHRSLATRSNKQIADLCKVHGDSFMTLFNFSGFDVKDGGCGSPQARASFDPPLGQRCNKVTPLFQSVRGNGWWGCDQPAACDTMIGRLAGSSDGVACVGTTNEYFLRGMLRQCKQHPVAKEMASMGLPLNGDLVTKLSLMMPPAGQCNCFYARLNDEYKTPYELMRQLERSFGSQLSATGAERIEIVSSCEPFEECQKRLHKKYGDRLILHSRRDEVVNVLDMTPSNAYMVYDLFRCARCPLQTYASKVTSCPQCSHEVIHTHGTPKKEWEHRLRPGAVPGTAAATPKDTCGFCIKQNDYSSSFFHAADMMHSRMHGVPGNADVVREI